jgi:hypothetical protein
MAMERSKCKQLLDVYKQAFDIVNTVVWISPLLSYLDLE